MWRKENKTRRKGNLLKKQKFTGEMKEREIRGRRRKCKGIENEGGKTEEGREGDID